MQKLQNIIASRASQYNHEMKRKEREFNKLKERLNQLLTDKREKKQGWLENKLLPIYLESLKALLSSNSQPLTPLAVSHWCVKQHWKSWWEEKPLENWQDWSKVSSWLTSIYISNILHCSTWIIILYLLTILKLNTFGFFLSSSDMRGSCLRPCWVTMRLDRESCC